MKTKQLFASILCITTLLLLTPRAAFANSGPKFWYGSDIYGSVTADKNCPITVEHELLTFDIADFPEHYGKNDDYKASVTAQYTFFNPTEDSITARLEFPFGVAPDYGTDRNDLTKYDITVNGAAIDKKVRHTFNAAFTQFELERDLPKIVDGFKDDSFFKPDLPVTKYVYEVTDYDKENSMTTVAFDCVTPYSGRFFLKDMDYCLGRTNGYRSTHPAYLGGNEITLYIFGEDFKPQWKFYQDRDCRHYASGEIELKTTERMTLKELAAAVAPNIENLSEEDWYNAFIDDLTFNGTSDYNPVIKSVQALGAGRGTLMRWYEYEITIPPHEEIVNTVTAPIYPDINIDPRPPVYDYTYLLSPAQGWADFGSLEVVVNTPFYLQKNDKTVYYEKFEKTETGYKAAFDGLPEGELEFSLCSAEKPAPSFWEMSSVLIPIIFNVIFVAGIVLIIAIVTTIIATTRRRKK